MLHVAMMKDIPGDWEVRLDGEVVMDGLTEMEAVWWAAGWRMACERNGLAVPDLKSDQERSDG